MDKWVEIICSPVQRQIDNITDTKKYYINDALDRDVVLLETRALVRTILSDADERGFFRVVRGMVLAYGVAAQIDDDFYNNLVYDILLTLKPLFREFKPRLSELLKTSQSFRQPPTRSSISQWPTVNDVVVHELEPFGRMLTEFKNYIKIDAVPFVNITCTRVRPGDFTDRICQFYTWILHRDLLGVL